MVARFFCTSVHSSSRQKSPTYSQKSTNIHKRAHRVHIAHKLCLQIHPHFFLRVSFFESLFVESLFFFESLFSSPLFRVPYFEPLFSSSFFRVPFSESLFFESLSTSADVPADTQGSFAVMLGSFAAIQGSLAEIQGSFADTQDFLADTQNSLSDL